MIYVDGIVLWLENCCRFKTLTAPNINSRFLFRCLSALSPSLLFGDCFKAWIVKLNATFLNNRPRKVFCNRTFSWSFIYFTGESSKLCEFLGSIMGYCLNTFILQIVLQLTKYSGFSTLILSEIYWGDHFCCRNLSFIRFLSSSILQILYNLFSIL